MEDIKPADIKKEYILKNEDYLLIQAIRDLTAAINRLMLIKR